MKLPDLVTHLRATCSPFTENSQRYVENLYWIAQNAEAKRVCEIGVGPEAVSGQTFAAVMGKGGYLCSYDIDQQKPTAAQKQWVKAQGVQWEQHYGDTLAFHCGSLGAEFDVLYVDGDHDGTHVEHEIAQFLPMVRKGGAVIFDDSCQVREVVRKYFPDAEELTYDLGTPNGHLLVRLK